MNNEFAISESKSSQFLVVAKSQYCVCRAKMLITLAFRLKTYEAS